ncbi:MAG TPA: hypothetical protein VFD46_00975 [Chryseolinea sp.]|nr:hypothetical protein [Chryseolinea sp.]
MKIKINITKDVLKRSMMCGVDPDLKPSENCAIAKAVTDVFPIVRIGVTVIFTDKSCSRSLCDLPHRAIQFIRKFDSLISSPEQRLDLPEFSFEIDVPDSYIERTIGIAEAHDILRNSKTLELKD